MPRISFDQKYIDRCHQPEQITWKDLKIHARRPPNFEAIAKVFPGAHRPGVCFAYQDAIYAPYSVKLPQEIIAHEITHLIQQREAGGAEVWWVEYLKSLEYRFQMELDAYRIEYRWLARHGNRHERRRAFKAIAGKLSGPLYKNMVTVRDAERYISEGGWSGPDQSIDTPAGE